MEEERWADINGYVGFYQVSNHGRVRNATKVMTPWAAGRNRGYMAIGLVSGGKKKKLYVHRLVAAAFLSQEDGCDQVNHKDGDTKNNGVENLEWVTGKDNIKHAMEVLGVDFSDYGVGVGLKPLHHPSYTGAVVAVPRGGFGVGYVMHGNIQMREARFAPSSVSQFINGKWPSRYCKGFEFVRIKTG